MTRSLAAIDADLAEVEAELELYRGDIQPGEHARMALLHDRAARLWRERWGALEAKG